MEFLLVSDIHADEFNKFAKIDPKTGMNTRLQWTIDIFDQIREYGEKNDIRTLLIGGDIFDKRGTIAVPVYDAVYNKLLELNAAGWAVTTIVGNHDQALRSGEIHALSPLPVSVVSEYEALPINSSDLAPVAGCVSFCETPREFLERLQKVALKKPDFYLIHQGVNGAKIAGDEILSRDEVSIEAIRKIVGEDVWVFSGHYHIYQTVGKRFVYIGNAVPKDFGDTTPKGFLHFKDGKIRQIESRAPKFVVVDADEKLDKNTFKGNYVQFQYTEEKAVANLEKLGAEGWIATRKKVQREYSRRSTINPEHSPLSIMRSYVADLRASGVLSEKLDDKDLFEVLKQIVEGRPLDQAFGGHKIELLGMQVKNFMSYKEQGILFDDLRGLILIEGENEDDPSAVSNGAGKSLIPEAVKWALFGTTARGVSGDKVVNKVVGKDCSVMLALRIDGEDTTITRYRKHTENKNQIFFSVCGRDCRGKTDADTQERIIKALGMNERTFDNTVFFGHNLTQNFAGLTDKEQKQILEMILGVEYFAELWEKAKELAKAAQEEFNQKEIKKAYTQTRLKEEEDRLAVLTEDYGRFENSIARQIEEQENIIAENADFLNTVADTKEEEALLSEKQLEMTSLVGELDNYEDEKKLALELKGRLAEIDKNIAKFDEQILVANLELKNLQRRVDDCTKQADELLLSKTEKKCPTCQQSLRSEDLIEEKHRIAVERQEALLLEMDNKLKERAAAENAKATWTEQRVIVLAESVLANERVVVLDDKLQKIEQLDRESKELEIEIEKIGRRLSVVEMKINAARAQIENLRATQNPLASSCLASEEKIFELRQELNATKALAAVAFDKFELYKFWETAFSDKGTPAQSPIKSYLFDAIVPVLDELARIYSEILSSGSIEVQFNTVTALKSGELRDKFSVNVENAFGATDYLGDSSGERRKVDLAIMFALHSLARIRSGSQFNVLFLDEILDSLDEEGCTRVMDLLHQMQEEIEKIFVITHNMNLKSRFAEKIVVRKRNGISCLV